MGTEWGLGWVKGGWRRGRSGLLSTQAAPFRQGAQAVDCAQDAHSATFHASRCTAPACSERSPCRAAAGGHLPLQWQREVVLRRHGGQGRGALEGRLFKWGAALRRLQRIRLLSAECRFMSAEFRRNVLWSIGAKCQKFAVCVGGIGAFASQLLPCRKSCPIPSQSHLPCPALPAGPFRPQRRRLLAGKFSWCPRSARSMRCWGRALLPLGLRCRPRQRVPHLDDACPALTVNQLF